LEQYSVTDEAFKNNLKLGREIADFLRKNIVQAERLHMQPGEENTDTYSTCRLLFFASLEVFIWRVEIRITEHTELGDNDTIKNPENMVEMPRRRRGKEGKVVNVE
jgi:peptide chain release factor